MGEFKQFCLNLQEAVAVGFIDPKKFQKSIKPKTKEPKTKSWKFIPFPGVSKYKGIDIYHTNHSIEREFERDHSPQDIEFAAKKAVDLLKSKPDEFNHDVGVYSKRLGAAVIWMYKKYKGKPALIAKTILPKKSFVKSFMSKKTSGLHNKKTFDIQPFLTENCLTNHEEGYIMFYIIN